MTWTESAIAAALDGQFFTVPNTDVIATITRRKYFDDTDRARLAEMYHAGKTYNQIAVALDYPCNKIAHRVRELGLPPRRKPG